MVNWERWRFSLCKSARIPPGRISRRFLIKPPIPREGSPPCRPVLDSSVVHHEKKVPYTQRAVRRKSPEGTTKVPAPFISIQGTGRRLCLGSAESQGAGKG